MQTIDSWSMDVSIDHNGELHYITGGYSDAKDQFVEAIEAISYNGQPEFDHPSEPGIYNVSGDFCVTWNDDGCSLSIHDAKWYRYKLELMKEAITP